MTSLVIEALNTNSGKASINDILYHMKEVDNEYSRDDVLNSITFLFALGKVNYDSKKDDVICIGGN